SSGSVKSDGTGCGANDPLTLTVNGPIASGARANLTADGGAGNDKVTVNYTGVLAGKLNLTARGGSGDDTIASTLTLSTGSTGSVKANENGGAGNDTLTLTVTGPIAPGATADLKAERRNAKDSPTAHCPALSTPYPH